MARPILLLLLLCSLSRPAPGADLTPEQLTAAQLVRAALTLTETQPLTLQPLAVALVMMEQAAEIAPDDPEIWRTLRRLAELADRDDLRTSALRAVARLDPHDDVTRLLLVNDAVERYQTVEERRAFYEKLLTGDTREALGRPVASRLAHDYAVLLDRSGDIEGFGRWLAEAVALDPANRTAAATAAGFFRMNARDAFAEAELLATLVMSDPTAVEAHSMMAELLLRNGAYVGAARFYGIAARTMTAMNERPAAGLLADQALAQWGAGDTAGALATIQRRQRELNDLYRAGLRREEPTLTPLEAAKRQSPVAATLATVRAAIHDRLGDSRADDTLRSALESHDAAAEALERAGASADRLAAQHLEAAFIALWLRSDGDVAPAREQLDQAIELLGDAGLDAEAAARFEAWMALRGGDAPRASRLFAELDDGSPATLVGRALALEAEGRRSDAARVLYELWQQHASTLIGVWSADRLAGMLGRRVALSPMSARLEELAATVPVVVDRLADDPTLGVSLRLLPAKPVFDPYEPIVVNVEITNNAPFPMAIDPRGPVRPQVAVLHTVQVTGDRQLRPEQTMIVDIDRRLRLDVNEQIVIPVDLRRGSLAQDLNRAPLHGAMIKVRAMMNFVMRTRTLSPGPLGSQVEAPPIRVNGVRLNDGWIAGSIADVIEPDSTEDLVTAAMLCHMIAGIVRLREEAPIQALEQLGRPRLIADEAAAAVTEGFSKLDPVSRSWLLGAIPRTDSLEPLYTLAMADETRVVRLSYLLYCLTRADDPMIDVVLRGEDPQLQQVALLMRNSIAALTGSAAGASGRPRPDAP